MVNARDLSTLKLGYWSMWHNREMLVLLLEKVPTEEN